MPRRLGRLLARKDFLRIASGRRRYAAPGFILQIAANPDLAASGARADGRRLGFTASKKVGNAVIRNRSKRRLRAAAAAIMAEHAAADHDYVLIARSETATRDWRLLLEDLERALRHLRAYRAEEGRESAP